jgi:hypothetical protein
VEEERRNDIATAFLMQESAAVPCAHTSDSTYNAKATSSRTQSHTSPSTTSSPATTSTTASPSFSLSYPTATAAATVSGDERRQLPPHVRVCGSVDHTQVMICEDEKLRRPDDGLPSPNLSHTHSVSGGRGSVDSHSSFDGASDGGLIAVQLGGRAHLVEFEYFPQADCDSEAHQSVPEYLWDQVQLLGKEKLVGVGWLCVCVSLCVHFSVFPLFNFLPL